MPYLSDLELPFLIGTVDRVNASLAVYSGELLTPLFAYRGIPIHLEAELCEALPVGLDYGGWNKELAPGKYSLAFPKVAVITSGLEGGELAAQVRTIREKCTSMLDNIASRINKEFMFKGTTPEQLLLFAGPESFQFFEVNFLKRLSEAFYNLAWAYASAEQRRPRITEQFLRYQNTYMQFASALGEDVLPSSLRQTYAEAKRLINDSSSP